MRRDGMKPSLLDADAEGSSPSQLRQCATYIDGWARDRAWRVGDLGVAVRIGNSDESFKVSEELGGGLRGENWESRKGPNPEAHFGEVVQMSRNG